jgi:hypothetical protein
MVHENRVDDMLSHGFTFETSMMAEDLGDRQQSIIYFPMWTPKESGPIFLSKAWFQSLFLTSKD